MVRVKEVDNSNKLQTLTYLRLDPLRHAFALNHLLYETNRGKMYGAFDDENRLKGYLLIRQTPTRQSIMLEANEECAKKLLEHLPDDNMTIITTPEILPLLKQRFPDVKPYRIDWVAVRRSEAHFYTPNTARRLTPSDAHQLAQLFRTSLIDGLKRYLTLKKVKTIREIPGLFLSPFKTGLTWFASRAERSKEWTQSAIVYGIFIDNKLVSVQQVKIRLPEVWVTGGGFTHPAYRGRGFATLCLSAIVKEALESAEYVIGAVRSDNKPMIRVISRIGYKKIGERAGVDIGTGFRS